MGFDQRTTEILAVNAVKDSIAISDFLEPYIAENDKEPSWDGFVYVYKEKTKRKENIIGRVPVQVKGTNCDDFSKTEISFQLPLAHLNNYLYGGGVILFVVYIGSNGVERKIYYAALTPIKLRKLIKDAAEQDSKSVRLKEFPTDNNRKATICLNCLKDCQRQASFTDAKLYTLDELQKSGQLNGLKIFISAIGEKDVKSAFLSNDVYIYADVKGCTIPLPIDALMEEKELLETVPAPVSVDGRLMYSKFKVVRTENTTTFQIGESFRITKVLSEPEGAVTINYKNSNMLRVRAKDLDFMISYMEHGSFYIDDMECPFDYEHVDISNFDIEGQKEHLRELKQSVQALDMLGYADDLDISKMEPEDSRNLRRLVIAFVEKKPVKNLKPDLPSIVPMRIENATFLLYLKQDENEEGTYEFLDFFKTELNVSYEENGVKIPTSQYILLKAKDLLEISNLRTGVLLASFQRIEKNKGTFDRGTLFLLELLKAYDLSEGKRHDLIDTALDFAKWTGDIAETEAEKNISKLNLMQTIKRMRPLNILELDPLYQMAENPLVSDEHKVAVYLLLDSQQFAHRYFNKLDQETKDKLRNMPIYHFWEEL